MNRLPIATCQITKSLETGFLNNHNFKLYELERDANNEPFVLYSQSTCQYYIKRDDSAITARDLQNVFGTNGHGLSIAYEFSYARPFALDLDCMLCHGNHSEIHLSELKVNEIYKEIESYLKKIDKRAIISLWNLKCGYHLYSNVFVSIAIQERIVNCLNAKYMHDTEIIAEMPKFMPLPYSAKIPGVLYKQTMQNDAELDNLVVFAGSDCYTYYDNCTVLMTRNNDDVCIPLNTIIGQKFITFHTEIVKRNNSIPNFNDVVSIEFENDMQKTQNKKLCTYIEKTMSITQKTRMFNCTNESDNLINYERLNSDDAFMEIVCNYRDQLEKYLLQFNTLYFANSDSVSIIDKSAKILVPGIFDKYVYYSAIHCGGLNIQHYVVTAQKLFKDVIDDEDFYHFIRTLYADIKDESIRHFMKTYNTIVEQMYVYDITTMFLYLRLYVIDRITPSMSTSDIFDSLACSRLGVESTEIFTQQLCTLKTVKLQKEYIDKFMNIMIDICEECHFLKSFNHQLYILEDGIFYYETFEHISFLTNWFNKDITEITVKNLLKSKASKFKVTRLCENNEYMIATSVGMFNTITGLYSSKTPLVKFNKGLFSSVWPMGRPLVAYDEQNCDILKMRKIVKSVVLTIRNNIDGIFVELLLKPALLSIHNVNDITNIQEFLEKLQQHKSLPNMSNMIEYFPFDRQFVVYLLELLCDHGLAVLCNYRKLCRVVLMHKKTASAEDWLENFNKMFRTTYDPNDTNGELFTCNDDDSSYYDKLSSFDCKYANFEKIDERVSIIGVTLAATITKCKSFKVLCKAFNIHRIPKPSKHYVKQFDIKIESVPTIKTYQRIFNRFIETVMIDKNDHFEKKLYIMALQICMSANFKENATRELLNIYSTLMVPINVLKKIYVLYGEQSTGKSHIMNVLTELMHPSGDSLNDLEEAQTRSGLASKKLFLRCNELKTLNPSIIKSITGNDPTSVKQFFVQKYELPLGGQAAVFAATNAYVEFKEFKVQSQSIDRAVIDRLHTIRLCGKQIHEQSNNSYADSIIAMISSDQYFISTTKLSLSDSANAMRWLIYENYMLTRNVENYKPYIDVDFEDSVNYRNMVYKNNCIIYDFLSQCGICEEPGFFMMSDTLLRIVSRDFASKDSGTASVLKVGSVINSSRFTIHEKVFYKLFKLQYNLDLSANVNIKIKDLQVEGLVLNIKENLKTEKDDNSVILEKDLMRRLNVYMDGVEKENALVYFKRINGPLRSLRKTRSVSGDTWNYNSAEDDGNDIDDADYSEIMCYGIPGIRFVNPLPDAYDGGERGEYDDDDNDSDYDNANEDTEKFNDDTDVCSELYNSDGTINLNANCNTFRNLSKKRKIDIVKNNYKKAKIYNDVYEDETSMSNDALINVNTFLKDSI